MTKNKTRKHKCAFLLSIFLLSLFVLPINNFQAYATTTTNKNKTTVTTPKKIIAKKKIVKKTVKKVTKATSKNKTPTKTVADTTTQINSYSLSDIANHKSITDCWTTIGGKVYNLTPFINQHPGGSSAILSLCGKDGTAAFNQKHGGQARPATELISLLVGNLK